LTFHGRKRKDVLEEKGVNEQHCTKITIEKKRITQYFIDNNIHGKSIGEEIRTSRNKTTEI